MGMGMVWLGGRQSPALTLDPEIDVPRLGLPASLWLYGVEEHKSPVVVGASAFAELPFSPEKERITKSKQLVEIGAFAAPQVSSFAGDLPNLVAVQSESFFDIRRRFAGIRPEVLHHFDRLCKTSTFHGLLEVPAWGANTVRTEFAFLSGLGTDSLGVHRFNPYRHLAQQGLPTLARFLRQLGYRTVCVHPYPAGFYSRNKVFPLLGIDEFIDIRSLGGAKKSGPYVGDIALAEKVCSLMEMYTRRPEPVFLFVITMENHGPLHLERITPDEVNRYYASPLPAGCDDLIVYLRHLVNADRMIGMLHEYLESIAVNNWFCFFGDHVPIMPKVYDIMGAPGRRTNYVLWNKGHILDGTIVHNMKVENLGALLLRNMGLLTIDHYLAAS
jgi:phosphoglycerol transferase MdoB-like AlkP superfamily enzyme